MEDVKVFTISELLQRSRPITATSSLQSPPSTRPLCRQIPPALPNHKPKPSDQPSSTSGSTDESPNPRTLRPLNYPAVLIGTLTLPAYHHPSTSTSNRLCTHGNCFVFSDGSSAICCDVLDFDVRIIGKKIHVVSWNFIPFKRKGGLLEIIRWRFSDSSCVISRCSSEDSFPLILDSSPACKNDLKAPYRVHGALESIGPVTVVPCSVEKGTSQTGGGSSKIRGFLAQVMACECKLCKLKEPSMGSHDSILLRNKANHSFTKLVIVYFCGSASSWHPVITKLIGNVVSLLGLKKKMVFIGKEESQLMYVTTEKASLHVPVLLNRWLPCRKTVIEGKGECGAYTGIVRGIYMHGMVIELDQDVWLLLTDGFLTPPHSLRVGTLISVRNVHFLNPKFSWAKILILGACSKTTINVESFSPLETGGHVVSQSQSILLKFINSLAFSARLWVLLVVSCFLKMFVGILSEQEILGSKHKEGLVQTYASSQLPSSVFQTRHGVFLELCKHEFSGCGSEPNYVHPKLVLPIAYFVSHCEATCTKMMLHLEKDSEIIGSNQSSFLSCKCRSYRQSVRKILSSDDLGILLLGSLKVQDSLGGIINLCTPKHDFVLSTQISSSSGKLQLVDVSGGIDVLIPDLQSFSNVDNVYEVNDYKLVMEGIPEHADHSGSVDIESFSCRRIFQNFPVAKEMNSAIYIYFHLQNSSCKNRPIYPCIDRKKDGQNLCNGTYHLLRVTHKFPVLQKFPGAPVITDGSSTFAESIVLPWDLFLAGLDSNMHLSKVPEAEQEKLSGNRGSRNYQHVSCKRRKVDHASSNIMDNLNDADDESCDLVNGCSSIHKKCSGHQKLRSLVEVPCLATINIDRNHNMVNPGFLYCTKTNVKVGIGWETNAQKVLLEFKSESLIKYQLLQIGGYYIIKDHKEDLSNPKDSKYVSGAKVVVTLGTRLWSTSFLPHELVSYIDPSHDLLFLKSSISNNERISGGPNQIELLLQRSANKCHESCLDVNVHSSADVLLEIDVKLLEEGLSKTVTVPEEVVNVSRFVDTTMTASIQPSGTAESGFLLPEGNLISLNGHVVALHSSDSNCSSLDGHLSHRKLGYVKQLRCSKGIRSSICIHVSVDDHIVRILDNLGKHAYPLGFGPGVDAAFYRILKSGQDDFMLTPVSYVIVSSIRVVNRQHSHKYTNSWAASSSYDAAVSNTISSGLMSYITKCDYKPMQFRSRVLAIHILVFEKKNKRYNDPQPSMHHKLAVNIPVAGFILDDGSSSCCCWANGERAATFLRLNEEIPTKSFESSCWTLKGIRMNKVCSTAIHFVDKILEKHGRIVVKNHGSTFDSSCQDLTFTVSSDNVFSSSDENILKIIIFNACLGTLWTVLGKVMDMDALGRLEKQLTEMERTLLPMQNIWVEEVRHSNSLVEARNMIQGLQNRSR